MRHKTFELIEVKAEGEAGEFSALASVFGNVDLVGDRMMKGAFEDTLKEWRKSGSPLPVVWSHDHDSPMSFIGEADPRAVMETEKGLLVQGKLDIGAGNPVADQVYKLMKRGLIKAWSFAYRVLADKQVGDVNEVSKVDLLEVGPTLVGANPEAQLQAVKSMLEETEEKLQEPTVEELQVQLKAAEERITELSQSKAIDATPEDPERDKARALDPLRKRSRELALESLSGGPPTRKPPSRTPAPEPSPSWEEQLRHSREQMLDVLRG